MRHWSQLATRNWRVRWSRTVGVLLAIALGAAAVVWVTSCFESVRRTVLTWATQYLGAAHVTVESPLGKYSIIPERIVDKLAALPEIKAMSTRLVQRLPARTADSAKVATADSKQLTIDPERVVDIHGIDPQGEFDIHQYAMVPGGGRMIDAGDEFKCVVEAAYAEENHIGLGDSVYIWGKSRDEPYRFEIVGLVSRRRLARFQKGWVIARLPDVQQVIAEPGGITSIDIVLHDGSKENVKALADRIRVAARKVVPNISVRSVEVRLQQIQTAQSQQELVLVLLSCVAMLTAMFIILSTLSMGAVERVRQLGLMRCIGLTGGQLAFLVLIEVLPLGILGILIGLPIGLGMTWITTLLVPEYLGDLPVTLDDVKSMFTGSVANFFTQLGLMLSRTGIGLATVAGVGITLVAASLPVLRAWSTSPLEASKPRAAGQRLRWILLSGAIGLVVLGAQAVLVSGAPEFLKPTLDPLLRAIGSAFGLHLNAEGLQRSPEFPFIASASTVMLYVGYALAAPLLVWLVGRVAVRVVALLVGVRERLLQDQVGHAVWRSTGIACGMMVGLSLIVGLVIFSESLKSGWEFPKQFPEGFVWNPTAVKLEGRGGIERIQGIRQFTLASTTQCIVGEQSPMFGRVYLSFTFYFGIEPAEFLDMIKMEFVEGDAVSARQQLEAGGHVIVTDDFTRTRNAHLGDSIDVQIGTTRHAFKIAGVMQSPALDIAAGYFQATSEAAVIASSSVIGSLSDLRKIFGVDGVSLALVNFDLPPTPIPAGWPPAPGATGAENIPAVCYDTRVPREKRYQRFREDQVLRNIITAFKAPTANHGTASELKDDIDKQLTQVTRLLAAVPTVALLVAAIGVANLMTASITTRARQLAILRAVGATKGLILRMVLGEALVLGFVGTLLGLLLGLHLAFDFTRMTLQMWGFRAGLTLPWDYLAIAITLTVGLCAAAGILPARHASRTNIVDALHVP